MLGQLDGAEADLRRALANRPDRARARALAPRSKLVARLLARAKALPDQR